MTDERHRPHGAAQLPDQHPIPSTADPSADPTLPAGSASRWVVPAGILGAVAVALFAIAITTDQILLPIIGMVWVVALWVAILLTGRKASGAARRSKRLTVLLVVMAAGIVLTFIGIYLVGTLGTT